MSVKMGDGTVIGEPRQYDDGKSMYAQIIVEIERDIASYEVLMQSIEELARSAPELNTCSELMKTIGGRIGELRIKIIENQKNIARYG